MIKKLKKHLTLIFISSVMGIFTLVFCLLINQTIQAKKEEEMNFFGRITTSLVLQLETSENLMQDLITAENAYDFILELRNQHNMPLYQTSESIYNIDTVLTNFKYAVKHSIAEAKNNTQNIPSSLSGILTFSAFKQHDFYGIKAEIIRQDTECLNLYIIKEAPSSFTILKSQLPFYLSIWVIVFGLIWILARFLIEKAMKPTEAALQSQKEFIAAVSHELKAPLAVILASAECIENDTTLSSESRQHTTVIDSECLRMSKLVQDLLLLSSVDANTWTLNITDIDVDTLLIHTYEKYEPICRQKGIRFLLNTTDELFPVLRADLDRINQILGILIDNAINYSFPESEISLGANVIKNMLVFSIIDHGMGISEKDKPFIFDRFYCADKSRTQREHYGLGLSIAKELVEMHNGRIELVDTPGGGCRFRISLSL